MFWRILPHATICIASDRVILFDVRQARYLMVPEPIDEQLRGWLEERRSRTAPAAIIRLLEQGDVLREADGRPINARPFNVAVPETLAAGRVESVRINVVEAACVSARVATTWLALCRWPLQRILRRIEDQQRARGNDDSRAGRPAAVARYDRARLYAPFARHCLLDSLAMHSWLSRHRVPCQLVFGVTGQPFAAHCWLQNDSVILSDTYERVSRFTPILAL
jgi:hypothetical protein